MLTAALTPTTTHAAMAISSEERNFFIALGERITLLRKAHGKLPKARQRFVREMLETVLAGSVTP